MKLWVPLVWFALAAVVASPAAAGQSVHFAQTGTCKPLFEPTGLPRPSPVTVTVPVSGGPTITAFPTDQDGPVGGVSPPITPTPPSSFPVTLPVGVPEDLCGTSQLGTVELKTTDCDEVQCVVHVTVLGEAWTTGVGLLRLDVHYWDGATPTTICTRTSVSSSISCAGSADATVPVYASAPCEPSFRVETSLEVDALDTPPHDVHLMESQATNGFRVAPTLLGDPSGATNETTAATPTETSNGTGSTTAPPPAPTTVTVLQEWPGCGGNVPGPTLVLALGVLAVAVVLLRRRA